MSETAQTLVMSAHILLGILLVTIILIQRGKGSDAGMAFGGGASGTVFGAAGSGTFLTKTTKWLFIGFIGTSLGLAYIHNNQTPVTSILDTVEEVQEGSSALPVAAPLPGQEDTSLQNALPQVEATTPDGTVLTTEPVSGAELVDAVETEVAESEEAADPATEEPEQ